MTSIASSLGNRPLSSLAGLHRQLSGTQNRQYVLRHFHDRPHTIHLVVATGPSVKLHQRKRLIAIRLEPFANQVLTVVVPANQHRVTSVTSAVAHGDAAEDVI